MNQPTPGSVPTTIPVSTSATLKELARTGINHVIAQNMTNFFVQMVNGRQNQLKATNGGLPFEHDIAMTREMDLVLANMRKCRDMLLSSIDTVFPDDEVDSDERGKIEVIEAPGT